MGLENHKRGDYMPLVATRKWFETITKAWNSDTDNVKSMADVQESILMVIDAPPTKGLTEKIESDVIDPENLKRIKVDNKAELILSIQEGKIKEFRFARPDDKPTAIMSGKYEDFDKVGKKEAEIVWQILDGKIRFKGALPRFTKHMDEYAKLWEIIIKNTEVP
jgi:putative sterol carrier protein